MSDSLIEKLKHCANLAEKEDRPEDAKAFRDAIDSIEFLLYTITKMQEVDKNPF